MTTAGSAAVTDTIDRGVTSKTSASLPHSRAQPLLIDDLDDPERDNKVWTREEVALLDLGSSSVSPWQVVAAQAAVGAVCALGFALWGSPSLMWSAFYGAMAVVLPGALMARGMSRKAGSAMGLAVGFMFWEMLKIGVAIAMLVIAARVVPDLSWPVLLVTMFVCMKMNWLALLWRGRKRTMRL